MTCPTPPSPFRILDFVPSGCCIIGEAGEILFWNQTLEAWTQCAASTMLGRNLFEQFPLLAQPRFRDRILGVLETGAPTVFSPALNPQFFPCIRSGGRPRVQQTVLNRLPPGEQGRLLLITVSDITDQFERGEKYRSARAQVVEEARVRGESEERLRRVLENMPVAVYALDANRRLVFWNREAERLSGYTAKEALEPGFFKALFPDPAWRKAVLQRLAREGSGFRNWECEFKRKDGPIRTIALSSIARTLPIPGWPGGWGVGMDITERTRAEEALRYAQKQESLGALAGGIAHDFNNIFAGVLGNLELVLDRLGETHGATPPLRRIRSEILRASELSRKMLAFSGQGSFTLDRIDLNRLLEDSEPQLARGLSPKAVLRCRFTEGLPPIAGDPVQIRQVLHYLVTNAAEALGSGAGSIELVTGIEALEAETIQRLFPGQALLPGLYGTIEVADTGCGISPENLPRIFDPFFSTKFAGRGLSLAVTQGILRGHKAGCAISSTLGRGTHFKLVFPSADPAPAEPSADRSVPGLSEGTILLADDEPVLREAVAEMLENAGYAVTPVQDGLEALEYFKAHRDEIGLVLMDLTMPRMDGKTAFLAIREIDPGAQVLLFSGFSEHDAALQFQGPGPAGFLLKPFRRAQLEEMVGRFVKPK